jgi:hypothetical protein
MFGVAEHWTDQAGAAAPRRAADRQHRVRVANVVLGLHGLRCADWQGRLTVAGPTGRSAVVDHAGALWPAAEKLLGRPIDPLDPALLDRVEALAGPPR